MMGDQSEPIFCPKCSAEIQAGDLACPNCGASTEDVSRTLTSGFTSILTNEDWERFAPGNVFGNRYTIIEEIGHGGMGRVFKAIDRSLGITVAIKIIRPEHASNPRVVELFKKETVLARSISSENVVRVYDLGEAENTKYISMDFVEGQNLRDLIFSSGSLTISTAIKFGQQICSGLAAAHKQGIIHRDLKPSNIMIDKTGRVRVMDFGLAMTIDRKDAKGVGAIIGTPEYLSPEQARGDDVDQRADIYAFGLILYEMVTGRPVFEAESLTGYIKKHCEVNPEPPSRVNHLIPAGLETLILKCLRKDRNERYQTADEVCRSLDLVVAPEVRSLRPFPSRMLRFSVWATACLLIGLLGFFVFFKPKPAAPAIRKAVAVMSFENLTGDPARDHISHLLQSLLIMDLELSRYLRLISRERLLQHLDDLHAPDTGLYSLEVLDKIASRENVDFFLLGSYMAYREEYRIDIRIFDARRNEFIDSWKSDRVALQDIQDRCDEMSIWTKGRLGPTKEDLAKDFDKELKKYTTHSIEALMYFFQGLDFYEKRDFRQSTESYSRAVDIDKKFALAYARLATNYSYEGRHEEAKKYLLRAMSLRRNLTPRERLLIEGDYFNAYECDYSRAIQTFKNLLTFYPEDEMALENLGAIYRNTERWDEARASFELLKVINPNSRIAVLNLVQIAEATGEYTQAAGILMSNRDVLSIPDELPVYLAACFLREGRTEQALAELGTLSPVSNGARAIPHWGHIHTALGHFPEAEAAYRRLLEDDQPGLTRFEGHFWLAHLYLLKGQYGSCAREIEEGMKLARSEGLLYEESLSCLLESYLLYLRHDFAGAHEAASRARQKAAEIPYPEGEIEALHRQGLCEVGLGRISDARKTLAAMDKIIDTIGYPKLRRCCYQLEGMIASAGNSWDEAVADFRKAVETLPQQHLEGGQQAAYIETLASALLESGDLEAARAEYEKIISLTSGRLTSGDVYARSFYQLGRICQEKKENEDAQKYLQSYLKILQNADVNLPEIQDARRRLAAVS